MKKLLIGLFLLLSWAVFGQSSIQKNYFTTNDNPALSITNGNLISTNIYVSNIFATNITVQNITNINEFRGRTTITTNLFVTNSLIQYLTNNYFYTTNVTEQFVTNQLSYITNLYGPFITNNTLYSTNIYVTNLTANYITNNTSYITNLYSSNIFTTNLYATNIYTTNLYSSNIFTTNLYATNIYTTNLYSSNIFTTNLYATNIYTTNLYSSNIFTTNLFTTNLFATYITNDTFYTTNLFVSNVFATNITVDVITNNLFVSSNIFTTNLFVSNIFTTNITLMEAIWNTNKWNGPTNDVSFKATYQKFVASTDMNITGLIDSSPSNANTSVLLITPGGANRTLYFPAVFTNYTSDGNNAYLIPSTNVATVTLFQYGNQNTNVVVRLFGPGTGTPAAVAEVLTNDGTYVFLSGLTLANAPWVIRVKDGSYFQGTNAPVVTDSANAATLYMPEIVSYADSNQPTTISGLVRAADNVNRAYYSQIVPLITGDPRFGTAGFEFTTLLTNGLLDDLFIESDPSGSGNGGTPILFASELGPQFTVSRLGVVTGKNFVDQAFAANGVVTNDSTGLLHTTPTLPSTLLPTDLAYVDKNNAFTTASSNYFAGPITGATNSSGTAPDMSKTSGCSLLSTNAAFAWLVPTSVDQTKTVQQWVEILVTNTTASAVAMTVPAPCTAVGTPYVTNLTDVWVMVYPFVCTNFYFIPCR